MAGIHLRRREPTFSIREHGFKSWLFLPQMQTLGGRGDDWRVTELLSLTEDI